jgi:pantothenate kinase
VTGPVVLSLADAVASARAHAAHGRRFVLGLVGPPGGGKSTLSDALAEALGDAARVVGMDGFHLAQEELRRLGREDRKGAPDTFDATGYVALLRRLRDPAEEVVYAPRFRRDLEEPIGSAVPVPREVALVVTEGNYLLLDDGPWALVRGLLDAAWYVATPDAVRVERLIARHVAHGRTPEAARAWVLRSDERNAALVAATRDRADAVVHLG